MNQQRVQYIVAKLFIHKTIECNYKYMLKLQRHFDETTDEVRAWMINYKPQKTIVVITKP